MSIFKGSATAIVTPFSKCGNYIAFDEFKKLIDYQIIGGTSAIVFLGTTGEPSTLTTEEKEEVAKFAIKYVNGRVPVILGAGSNCTADAIKQSKLYERLGADALLHVTPYYNKCTQKGLVEHFNAIANNVNIPIILYNVPGRTGVNMLPATVKKLSEHENIVAVKEACGNIEQIMETIRLCGEDFDVYSGDDAILLPVLSAGGKGVISVAGNVVPDLMSGICSNFFEGNINKSKEIQLQLMPLIKALFSEVNPIPVKAALNLKGFDVGPCRLPLTEIDSENLFKLRSCYKDLGIGV